MTSAGFRSRAGWVPFVLSLLFVTAAALLVRGAPSDVPGLEVATNEDVVDAFFNLGFPLVGALILTRDPGNLFGWAFALVGLSFEASQFAGSYATYATFTHPGSLPAARVMSLLSDVLIVATFLLLLVFVPLLFPTGRPPTRRWWAVGAAGCAAFVLGVVAAAIRPGPVDEDVASSGPNPFGIGGAAGVADALELAALVLLFLAAVGAVASLVVRARRSRAIERRQLKIFGAAVGLVLALVLLPEEPLGLESELAQITMALVVLLALPGAVAVALLGMRPESAEAPV
jgi:hypothetical protein